MSQKTPTFRFVFQPWDGHSDIADYTTWHGQRSRWMKGFAQTWISHMHAPYAPGGTCGAKRFFTLNITVGMTLMCALFYIPGLFMVIAGLWVFPDVSTPTSKIWMLSILGFSYATGILIGVAGARRSGQNHLIAACLFMPIYWVIFLPSAVKALREMRNSPFFWNKTEHGRIKHNHMKPAQVQQLHAKPSLAKPSLAKPSPVKPTQTIPLVPALPASRAIESELPHG